MLKHYSSCLRQELPKMTIHSNRDTVAMRREASETILFLLAEIKLNNYTNQSLRASYYLLPLL